MPSGTIPAYDDSTGTGNTATPNGVATMQACFNAFSNFVAADQCQAAITGGHAIPAALAVAVIGAAIFASLFSRYL